MAASNTKTYTAYVGCGESTKLSGIMSGAGNIPKLVEIGRPENAEDAGFYPRKGRGN